MARTVGTNNEVASAWKNNRPMRSHNGNFETNGSDVWSYRMLIGRTLEDGTKQVLDVSGVNSYSVTTSQHVSDLGWHNVERVQPIHISRGYGSWRNFPQNSSITEYRVTSKVWKTEQGAIKNCKADTHVTETYHGYTLSAYQYIGNDGHVMSKEDYDRQTLEMSVLAE